VRLWIAVPAYNEAPTLAAVVAGARAFGPVLVVDDGSTDGTADAAREAGAEVVRHPRRLGKGAALRSAVAALRRRGASHVITLDADGQHAPADIPALLAAARARPRALVVAGRLPRTPSGQPPLPPPRRHAVRLAGLLVRWSTGLALRDTQSGLRLYPLAVFDETATARGGFVFETEILVAAAAQGFEILEVAATVIPRAARRSRFRPLLDGAAIGAYLARTTAVAGARGVRRALARRRPGARRRELEAPLA
jgi:glycosyltransferase involved in cell wall biosynthesis